MEYGKTVSLPEDVSVDDFAKELSGDIIDKYEKTLLSNMIDSELSFAPREHRMEILEKALREAKPNGDEVLSLIHYNRRKAIIEEDIKEYFKYNNTMNTEGFVRFRLFDYKNELRGIYLAAAEEFASEKEYEEFIEMLRFFVSVQSPKEDTVHLTKKDGELCVQNRHRRDITYKYAEEFTQTDENLTGDDIALSALIAIAPQKITIHDKREADPLYDTIYSIFDDVVFTVK